MATLEDLKPEKRVDGLVVGSSVTAIATSWHGSETLEVVYRTADGAVDNRLLSRSDEQRLSIAAEERQWSLDADGRLLGSPTPFDDWEGLSKPPSQKSLRLRLCLTLRLRRTRRILK